MERKPDMDFTVIDITTNGLDDDSEIVSFAALRFENGVPTDRFFEYVNSGAVLSDSISEILGITNDTLQRYGTTMEDAYWQFIEFCCDSNLVAMRHDFDSKFIERLCRDYDLPALKNHITDLDTTFHLNIIEATAHSSLRNSFVSQQAKTVTGGILTLPERCS